MMLVEEESDRVIAVFIQDRFRRYGEMLINVVYGEFDNMVSLTLLGLTVARVRSRRAAGAGGGAVC